jgi:hypothetical protein
MPTFDEILTQVLALLQREGRVAYRVLKRRFALDDEYLEDIKAATGATSPSPPATASSPSRDMPLQNTS